MDLYNLYIYIILFDSNKDQAGPFDWSLDTVDKNQFNACP